MDIKLTLFAPRLLGWTSRLTVSNGKMVFSILVTVWSSPKLDPCGKTCSILHMTIWGISASKSLMMCSGMTTTGQTCTKIYLKPIFLPVLIVSITRVEPPNQSVCYILSQCLTSVVTQLQSISLALAYEMMSLTVL